MVTQVKGTQVKGRAKTVKILIIVIHSDIWKHL